MPIRKRPHLISQWARDNERLNGTTYSTALSSPPWSSLIPEGNVFLDEAGGGDGCVVETLAEEGSLLLAGGLCECQGHGSIVTAAHKGSTMRAGRNKVPSLSAGRGVFCAQKLSEV